MKKTKKMLAQFDFENSLAELENIVTAMEKGDLSLEDSLKYFETGINLTRQCQNSLQEAEQKVKILSLQKNNEVLKDFTINEKNNIEHNDE